MTEAKRIIDAIGVGTGQGRLAVAVAVGVGTTRVRQAEKNGLMPASWARTIIQMCEENGVTLSSEAVDEVFDWRPRYYVR